MLRFLYTVGGETWDESPIRITARSAPSTAMDESFATIRVTGHGTQDYGRAKMVAVPGIAASWDGSSPSNMG